MKKVRLENLTYRGAARLERIDCPLCGHDQFATLVVEQTLPVVRCRRCDLVFANPRPDAEGLRDFYKDYFPPESESLWQKQMSEIFFEEGWRKIDGLEKKGAIRIGAGRKILDVGCGMGYFLELMRARGWKTKGVEPAPAAARHAREVLKLDIHEGGIEDAALSKYDVVTLWYVMEHVPNPDQILNKVAAVLDPGGLVIIRVPNQNVAIDRVLAALGLGKFFLINPPRHLFDYSPKTLARFLEDRGFEILEIRNGLPRATGTWLELLRRYLWYGFFQLLYGLSGGRFVRGSSMTLYARKK